MNKYIYLGLMALFIYGFVLLYKDRYNTGVIQNEKKENSTKTNPTHYQLQPTTSHSIFIPYWAGNGEVNETKYDTYYYFGISPTIDGSIEDDVGYKNISLVHSVPEKQKKIVLRMLDAQVTDILLQDVGAQKKLFTELKRIMVDSQFSGVVIDLEVPLTFQNDKEKQITNFVQQMCTSVHTNYKSCSVLVYGDVVYRKRPYELKKLGKIADTILVMAYDFHKAGGEPGPNFPLDRRSPKGEGGFDYGYDFKTMVKDTLDLIPKEKIEVVFGMYGYDWTMNEQGTSLKAAKALTLNELKLVTRNLKLTTQKDEKLQASSFKLQSNKSWEKSIQYIDEDGRNHIVWYEDEESVAVKTKYLQEQGIWQVSYWAYGYY